MEFIAKYTDVVTGWSTMLGVEFYLRDCAFNRGPKGAARILQRASASRMMARWVHRPAARLQA